MGVELRCESAAGRRYSRALKRDAVALMRALGLGSCELSLSMVTDDSIRALNRDYRHKDKPTDVLSFSQLETSPLTPLHSGEGNRLGERTSSVPLPPFPKGEGGRGVGSRRTSPLTPLPAGEGNRKRAFDPLSGSPFPKGEGGRGVGSLPLGDVVISIDTALAQARRYAVAPRERLRALLIHGVLHLLGYDHERSRADARAMFARERELSAMLDGRPPRRRRRASR